MMNYTFMLSAQDALREGRVVVLALPYQFQTSLASLSELRPGTVVVDPSNRCDIQIRG